MATSIIKKNKKPEMKEKNPDPSPPKREKNHEKLFENHSTLVTRDKIHPVMSDQNKIMQDRPIINDSKNGAIMRIKTFGSVRLSRAFCMDVKTLDKPGSCLGS